MRRQSVRIESEEKTGLGAEGVGLRGEVESMVSK